LIAVSGFAPHGDEERSRACAAGVIFDPGDFRVGSGALDELYAGDDFVESHFCLTLIEIAGLRYLGGDRFCATCSFSILNGT
jgi:hypothetical protein